jgi:hypothetical protein
MKESCYGSVARSLHRNLARGTEECPSLGLDFNPGSLDYRDSLN